MQPRGGPIALEPAVHPRLEGVGHFMQQLIEFQSATALPTGGVDPATLSPWRQALGGAAATNLNTDGGNTVRWRATYNRATYPDMVVMELRMSGTSYPPNPTAPLEWSNVWTSPGTVAQGGPKHHVGQVIAHSVQPLP